MSLSHSSSTTFTSARKQIEQYQKFIASSLKKDGQVLTEADFLEKLAHSKPEFLNFHNFPWIDRTQVEARVKGQFDRLVIHGFPDRANRLRYLFNVLKKKWSKKPEQTTGLLTFFLDLSEAYPIAVGINDSGLIYSEEIEEEAGAIVASPEALGADELEAELEARKFKEMIVKELQSEIQEEAVLHYSDDEELSDWESEGSEEEIKFPEDEETYETYQESGVGPSSARRSATMHDFTRHQENFVPIQLDPQLIRAARTRHWHSVEQQAQQSISNSIRKVEPIPLVEIGQPVISSLYVFRARFGEWWEWQKPTLSPNLSIILENDVIREILWQFCAPGPGIIFASDFRVNPNLMLRSLTKTALDSLMQDFTTALQRLHHMKRFIATTEARRSNSTNTKIIRAYSSALATILNSTLAPTMHQLEVELRQNRTSDLSQNTPTTLVRLRSRLNETLCLIQTLWRIHSEIFELANTTTGYQNRTLIFSKLETILTHWILPNSKIYGLVLYLYLQVLKAFVSEIFIEPLQQHSVLAQNGFFIRAQDLSINDPEFLKKCVTLCPNQGIDALTPEWTEDVLPKILHILKILSMFQAIGNNGPNSKVSKLLPKSLDEIVEKVVEALGIVHEPSSSETRYDQLQQDSKVQEFLNNSQNLHSDNAIQRSFLRLLEPKPIPKLESSLLYNLSNLSTIPNHKIVQASSTTLLGYLTPISGTLNLHLESLVSKFKVQEAVHLLQDILYASREDFVFEVFQLARIVDEMKARANREKMLHLQEQFFQDELNSKFQELLGKYFIMENSEGVGGGDAPFNLFTIDYIHNEQLELGFEFRLTTHFPLNLILTQPKLNQMTVIWTQLWRIAKSWWWLRDLRMKDCNMLGTGAGAIAHFGRVLLLKYWTLSFVSSVRSFVMLEKSDAKDSGSLYALLTHPIMDRIIIRSLAKAAKCFGTRWTQPNGPNIIQLGKIEQIIVGILDAVAGAQKFSFMYRLASYLPSDVSIIQESRVQHQGPGNVGINRTMSNDTILRTLSDTLLQASQSATSLSHLLHR